MLGFFYEMSEKQNFSEHNQKSLIFDDSNHAQEPLVLDNFL